MRYEIALQPVVLLITRRAPEIRRCRQATTELEERPDASRCVEAAI